jgi:hypothetical protein
MPHSAQSLDTIAITYADSWGYLAASQKLTVAVSYGSVKIALSEKQMSSVGRNGRTGADEQQISVLL